MSVGIEHGASAHKANTKCAARKVRSMPGKIPTLIQRKRLADGRNSAHSRGYGYRWRKLRDVVLRREPLCRECAAVGITRPAEDIDHVRSKADGGDDSLDNLRPLCHSCHSRKTAREDGGLGRLKTANMAGSVSKSNSLTAKLADNQTFVF